MDHEMYEKGNKILLRLEVDVPVELHDGTKVIVQQWKCVIVDKNEDKAGIEPNVIEFGCEEVVRMFIEHNEWKKMPQ